MGGASTEIRPGTDPIDVVHRGGALRPRRRSPAAPGGTSCPARRPAGSSARSTRSCRRSRPSGPRALLVEHGGGTIAAGRTDVGAAPAATPVRMALDLPDRVAGVAYPPGATARRLGQVGCAVELAAGADGRGQVVATPPSWRPDLAQPADLVEEVLRLEGYDDDPVRAAHRARRTRAHPGAAPPPRGVGRPGRGGLRRGAAVPVRRAGHVGRVRAARRRPPPPHGARPQPARRRPRGARHHAAARPARHARAQPVARRRGPRALHRRPGRAAAPRAAPTARAGRRQAPLGRRDAPRSSPRCPPSRCTSAWCWPATGSPAVGGGAGGRRAGPTPCRPRGSSAQAARVELRITAGDNPPWHPGRCAMLRVGDFPVGFAGELHPKVIDALGLPPRTCAMELDLDLAPAAWTTGRCRGCRRTRRWRWTSRWSRPTDGARRRADRRPARRRRRPPGGRAPVRRLHRRAGRRRATGRWPTRCASGPRTAR